MGSTVGGAGVIRKVADVLLAAVLAIAMLAIGACGHPRQSTAQAAAVTLPVVRPDSDGLLLTWIDDKGDFHVETRASDVPIMGRDTVRVVDPAREASAGSDVVVADFRQTGANGAYPVRTMLRTDFEDIAVARRKQAGPTLAGAAPSAVAADTTSQTAAQGAEPTKSPRPVVIIYGAEWCGACHDAARYLRRKGVAYIEKDIEKEPDAAREMQQKLASRGLRGGSIPVIDIRGKVMVGFDPGQIDAALGQAL
jgi:glutaredoxin